jgi:hypothetical protein
MVDCVTSMTAPPDEVLKLQRLLPDSAGSTTLPVSRGFTAVRIGSPWRFWFNSSTSAFAAVWQMPTFPQTW